MDSLFNYTHDMLPSDWKEFKAVILKNKDFKSAKEKNNLGEFEYIFNKIAKLPIAKYDMDDMKVFTDIPKGDFHRTRRSKSALTTDEIHALES